MKGYIIVTILSGRTIAIQAGVPLLPLIALLVRKGEHWEIDYSQAGGTEMVEWKRADISGRAVLAHNEGRLLVFGGKEYFHPQELEDAIVASGFGPTDVEVDRDDETGLWLRGVTG